MKNFINSNKAKIFKKEDGKKQNRNIYLIIMI